MRMHDATAWRHVLDGTGFVPDQVVAPEVVQQHDHVERVGHGIQAAAEMRADGVAVEAAELEFDDNLAEVVREALHADSGTQERRPPFHPVAQLAGREAHRYRHRMPRASSSLRARSGRSVMSPSTP